MRLQLFNRGAAPAAPTFDASAWLDQWSEHGGVAILTTEGRLILSCIDAIDRRAATRLQFLRAEVLRKRGGEAVRDALRRRQNGEGR